MKFTSVSTIAWLLLCASSYAQENIAGGVVYGDKGAFNISPPDGWVLDVKAGVEQGLPCVLYPKGSSWSGADTVMYANVAGEEFTDAAAFAARAIQEMKKKHGIPKEKIASGKTKGGEAYFINEYPATAAYSQWEQVAYIQLPGAVGYVVLSSRNEKSYRKDKHALEDVLKTVFYVGKVELKRDNS
ncbi:MAG: hypothetical protein JOZ08_16055 [Verrucomicrobia bacterium]|nr:hypothetical protein [Verrucomicrobiota bacterium]